MQLHATSKLTRVVSGHDGPLGKIIYRLATIAQRLNQGSPNYAWPKPLINW